MSDEQRTKSNLIRTRGRSSRFLADAIEEDSSMKRVGNNIQITPSLSLLNQS